MSECLQAIRGMNDVLPNESHKWRLVERAIIQCLGQYGYEEIRLPLVESTQLFKRTIGEITDIVEKEMYTFDDLNGESISLRPEGTAGCVRACLEHGLLHNQKQKLWYYGPMFRHEKPQKGRYRQFFQMGVEALGISGVAIELELIALCRRFWNVLGISDAVQLQINTLGELTERQKYRESLIDYFKANLKDLDEDSKRRLLNNPLRILDSKNPQMKQLIADAPKLIDEISESSRQYFEEFCDGLTELGIGYTINPTLVRGLDYYGHTVFEWVTDKLGSQSTICAGGRYDKLVEQLGGRSAPAIGFAMGIERILLLRDALELKTDLKAKPAIFFIAVGDVALVRALCLAEELRQELPDFQVLVNTVGGSLKNQFKKADKSGATLALILGEDELNQHAISIKKLRKQAEQEVIAQQELISFVKNYFAVVQE